MKLFKRVLMALSLCLSFTAQADNVLVIDGQYNSATTNVVSRLQAAAELKVGQQQWDDVKNRTVQLNVKVLF